MDDMKITSMFVLLLALLSSFQLITAGESKNASQPHIIFILADDLVSSLRKQNTTSLYLAALVYYNLSTSSILS